MRKKSLAVLLSLALAFTLVLGSVVMGSAASQPPRDRVLIGIVVPLTGPLAGFGEGSPWAENLIVEYVNKDGGIYFKEYDRKLPIEIRVYDSESDVTKAAEFAQRLIQQDRVDMIVVRHTPETVNAVSAMAERFSVPCVSMDAPMDAWLAEGPYEWSFHAFWKLEQMYAAYSTMWKMAGFGKGAKPKTFQLFPLYQGCICPVFKCRFHKRMAVRNRSGKRGKQCPFLDSPGIDAYRGKTAGSAVCKREYFRPNRPGQFSVFKKQSVKDPVRGHAPSPQLL